MGNRVFCLEFTLQKHISLADFVVITVYFKPKRQPHGLSFVLRAENETRARGCASDNLAPFTLPPPSCRKAAPRGLRGRSVGPSPSQYETRTGNLTAACLLSERKTRLELEAGPRTVSRLQRYPRLPCGRLPLGGIGVARPGRR